MLHSPCGNMPTDADHTHIFLFMFKTVDRGKHTFLCVVEAFCWCIHLSLYVGTLGTCIHLIALHYSIWTIFIVCSCGFSVSLSFPAIQFHCWLAQSSVCVPCECRLRKAFAKTSSALMISLFLFLLLLTTSCNNIANTFSHSNPNPNPFSLVMFAMDLDLCLRFFSSSFQKKQIQSNQTKWLHQFVYG